MPRGHPYMQSRFTRTLPSWSGQLHTNRNTNTRMLSERIGGGIVGGNGYVVPSLPPTVSRLALPKLSQSIARNAINAGVAEAFTRMSAADGSDLPGPALGEEDERTLNTVGIDDSGTLAIVGHNNKGAVIYKRREQKLPQTFFFDPKDVNPRDWTEFAIISSTVLGKSVAISGLGNRIIMGGASSAQVFENSAGSKEEANWTAVGSDTLSAPQEIMMERSVDLNSDGSMAIVGSSEGGANLYFESSGTWQGLTIPPGDLQLGRAVALATDYSIVGSFVAILGSYGKGAEVFTSEQSGVAVSVVRLHGPSETNSSLSDSRGMSVALNAAGNRAIVGSNGSGAVVYEYDPVSKNPSGTLSQLGGTLSGFGDYSGSSVALNDAGDRALVGGSEGAIAYQLDSNNRWVRIGSTLAGSTQANRGISVAMNGAGNTAILGSFGAVVYETGA